MGIEPTPSAWEAEVLPLYYTRRKRADNYDKITRDNPYPNKMSFRINFFERNVCLSASMARVQCSDEKLILKFILSDCIAR